MNILVSGKKFLTVFYLATIAVSASASAQDYAAGLSGTPNSQASQAQALRSGSNSTAIGRYSNDSTGIAATLSNGGSLAVGLKPAPPKPAVAPTCNQNTPYLNAPATPVTGAAIRGASGSCTFQPMYENMKSALSAGNLNEVRSISYQSSGKSCNSVSQTGSISNVVGTVQYLCTTAGWVQVTQPSCSSLSTNTSNGIYKDNC